MDIPVLGNNPVLSFFSAYQTAYQQATGLVSLATLGLPTWMHAPNVPDTQVKSFVLVYTPAQVPTSSIPGISGVQPQQGAVRGPVGPLIFDVFLGGATNGIPQRVAYTNVARQTIEQTAVGFHVNEFGLAPGRLEIDALIVYQGMQYAQVENFFSFLRQIKTTNPLGQVTPPGEVLFLDIYLQHKISITVETLMIEEVAGSNNQAHLVMGASVLKDYSAASMNTATQSGLPPSIQNLEAAAGLLGGVLDFIGVSLPI